MPSQPPKRALVVIDVQNEYFERGCLPIEHPPRTRTLPNVAAAMDAARQAAVPVVVVQHHAAKGAPLFQPGTHAAELHEAVAGRPRDHLVTKAFPSAFAGTDLAEWLAARHIDTLSVAGYMTQHCVASTIFEGMHRGFTMEFLHDASGALSYANAAGRASAEDIHRVLSVVFHSSFAAVASTAAWVEAVQQHQPLPRDNLVLSNRRALEMPAR
ncbi:isochorismatase family protein [Ramlibacter algicola]|uniref:Isochorismatase family protein n=1 Tax=Ramlibacter algicola TaxID=2795217 RepID=A0A934UTM6_9BURK|nr:isochorismatase family protein [Ramlibacter algicola]MBK0394913.1 isochorismatase family protein [Ramlibacter algicola]